MTFTIATTLARNQTHPDLLKSALQFLLDQDDETLEIIAMNNKKLLFNKKLLMLFSPSLRTCLADIPCCGVQPSISAPSVSANCVAKVQEILLNTVNNVPIQWSDDDVDDIVEAAEVLGIEMKNIRLSLLPTASSSSVKRKRDNVLPKIEPDILELPDEPVTQEVDEDDLEEGALTINVDVSSDEDDEYEPAAGVDTAEENSNSEMLTEDSSDVISDDDESLQEESEDIVFGSVNDSQEEAVLVSADEALNDKTVPEDDAEPKIRCEICGKAQRGPSSLREHYSLTHFFQELFDKFVAPTGDHTWCRY